MAEERKPRYKVGDVVTIRQFSTINYRSGDYRFGLNSDMMAMSGKSCTIKSVQPSGADPGRIPDDGYLYRLEEEAWSWASSMFEDPSGDSLSCIDEISDGSIDAFIRRKKCPELDFNL